MLQSVWIRLCKRRSILPVRDIFDADLDRARRKPGCALCRLVQEHDQQGMHNFLWEYCTDPHIGVQISTSWGFCPYHTWSLALLEHERMGDGLGITIVYQALLKHLHRLLSDERLAKNQRLHLVLPAGPEVGSATCRLCQSAQREESLFLSRLVKRFLPAMSSGDEREWSSLQTELCLPHIGHLLETCSEAGAASPSPWYRLRHAHHSTPPDAAQQRGMQTLAIRLSEYAAVQRGIKLDAHREEYDWRQISHDLAFLVGAREALPVHATSQAGQAASHQLLLIPGQPSQFQSPASKECPVCAAAAFACIALCSSTFEQRDSLPSMAAFCQSHHWILAASIALFTANRDRYRFWLKQQQEQQQARLTYTHGYGFSERKQACMACASAAERSEERITPLLEGLRQSTGDLRVPQEELLCLFHWKQAHDACRDQPDAFLLQERLLSRQQHHLLQLDRAAEAYLARFNATKRERGEIPDIPGAAWAWERLLAFFAGEPTLVFPRST
jgi:hypothetical protein